MKWSKWVIKIVFLLICISSGLAQPKYWIPDSCSSLLPAHCASVVCSEWLASCSYELSPETLACLSMCGCEPTPVRQLTTRHIPADQVRLGFALEQIAAEAFISRGLSGREVKVGIIDGGFLNADKNIALSHIFDKGNIAYYKDYVTPNLEPYMGAIGLDDGHGTEVWELIGGYHPKKNIRYGLATNSIYYLARTDHGGYERRLEEDYMIQAMEEMHGMGVKLFNISLGYTEDFTKIEENHSVDEVDGQSTMLTRALDIAALEKGILIVIAAGNDGERDWETLSIPADAKNVLTVGASKYTVWDKMNYSSIGPAGLGYIKPDIAVYSTLGTSFSAPVITGLAACIMEYDSTLTNFEMMDIFREAGHLYPYGNNYLGYGVPSCPNIWKILQGRAHEIDRPEKVETKQASVTLTGDFNKKRVVVYHKVNAHDVSHRLMLKPKKDRLKIKRPAGITHSTVLVGKQVTEIFWKKD